MKHRAHITVFQDGKKYLGCCACDKKFGIGEYRYLKRHIALVHEGKPYKCPFCSNYFPHEDELEKHKATVHEEKKLSFNCTVCNAEFPLKSNLNTHMETVHEDIQSNAQKPVYDSEDPNSCNICQITFCQKQYYQDHITSVQDGKKSLKCCSCGAIFRYGYSEGFIKHIASVHEGKTFKCFAKRCTACFVESEELEEHDLTVHDGKMMVKYIKLKEKQSKERVPPSQKRVICTVCGKSYTTKNVLKLHVNQVHLKQRKYCDQCPMSFSTATSIRWVMEFLTLGCKIS